MQTLNVGAGRSDLEYKATEERRREELRDDIQSDANYFFWAAGLAAVGSGIFPIKLNLLFTVGVIDLLSIYGKAISHEYPLLVPLAAAIWVNVILAMGFLARKGYRWAFWVGIVLYGADMIPLVTMFSLWAFGIHAFFVYKWFQGQNAIKEISTTSA